MLNGSNYRVGYYFNIILILLFEIMHLSDFNLRNEKEDFLRVDLLFFLFYDMRWIIQGLSVFKSFRF